MQLFKIAGTISAAISVASAYFVPHAPAYLVLQNTEGDLDWSLVSGSKNGALTVAPGISNPNTAVRGIWQEDGSIMVGKKYIGFKDNKFQIGDDKACFYSEESQGYNYLFYRDSPVFASVPSGNENTFELTLCHQNGNNCEGIMNNIMVFESDSELTSAIYKMSTA